MYTNINGCNNQEPQITVYNYDAIDLFVDKVNEIYRQQDKCVKLKLNEIIDYISSIAQPQCIQGEENLPLELIGQGTSSVCYEVKDKIYKVFYPRDLVDVGACEIVDKGAYKFLWLSDMATMEQAERFLKRYIRFILQKEIIDLLDIENDNEFIKPKLKLTSFGFVWTVDNFNGCTLEEDFKKNHIVMPTNNPIKDSLNEILYRIEKIKQVAVNVKVYCHENKVFHSDIKPSNFYVIQSKKGTHEDIVRNIDFDSWMSEQRFKEGFLDLLSTTPLFYFDCPEFVNTNQSIEKWKIYDIRALSKMLMYALIENDERKAIVSRESIYNKDFDWIDFFFDRPSVKKLFEKFATFGAAGLFVFDRLKRLLFNCSTYAVPQNVIRNIEEFINELEDIENLIGALISGNPPATLNGSAIKYLGLRQFDVERGNKHLPYAEYDELVAKGLSCDWVQYIIEKNLAENINPELFSSILYKGELYKPCVENRQSALMRLMCDKWDRHGYNNLLLLGKSSLGKSVNIKTLILYFLSRDVKFYFINLHDFNSSKQMLKYFKEQYNRLPEGTVLIMDSYDELYDERAKSFFNSVIRDTSNMHKISKIVASRYEPYYKTKENDKSESLFKGYEKAELQELDDEQVERVLSSLSLTVDNFNLKKLLKITMFLSLYLDIYKKSPIQIKKLNCANNDISFLRGYFEALFKEKNNDKKANIYIKNIGRACYFNRRHLCVNDKVDIPRELNGIYRQVKSKAYGHRIKSYHDKFINYATATYIKDELVDEYNKNDRKFSKTIIESLLGSVSPVAIKDKEIMYYVGCILKEDNQGSEILKNIDINYPKENTTAYANILQIFVGFNDGVINTKNENKVFNVGKRFLRVCNTHYLLLNNPYITSINSLCLKKLFIYSERPAITKSLLLNFLAHIFSYIFFAFVLLYRRFILHENDFYLTIDSNTLFKNLIRKHFHLFSLNSQDIVKTA